MSATVTGTVLTVVGWKKRPPAANATTTSAAAATAATNANFSGRLVGPSIGSRKPKAGCDFRSLITCSKARPTSTRVSGTASSVAIERASSDTTSKRPWHSVQPSRWAASAPERASGSSTIRRRVPSVRCATGDLLAQCGFCAPQQSSDLSDADAERLRDLGVAQPACAHCERGGGPRSQPAKRPSHLTAIFTDLELLLGVERVVAFLQRLRRLALLPASGPSQAVEGGMGGGPMQPCGRVFRRRRVEPVGELFGRHPIGFVQDYVLPDVDAPRIVLIAARRAPDRSVVLVHRRRHGDRRREPHPAGDVVEQPVADPHRFDAPAVAALQALDREAVLTGLAEVVGRADDHPELRRPGAAGLALPPRPARFGRPLGLGRRLLVVGHEPKVTCRSRRPGAWGPRLAAPGAAR